ncbi:hypothetical protein H5410_031621 [Solanum commersonii]|uniref:Uncharacterized protein n=1 Tax=Solanum commersonii TaxID=4109 RepID=A0A9J5YHP4_SOLCO|nr:hypothetical protein H5410_031621 [Solanum commersonii]
MNKLFDYYVEKSSKNSLDVPYSPTSSDNSSSISSVSGSGNFVNRGRMRTKQQFEKHKEVSGISSKRLVSCDVLIKKGVHCPALVDLWILTLEYGILWELIASV